MLSPLIHLTQPPHYLLSLMMMRMMKTPTPTLHKFTNPAIITASPCDIALASTYPLTPLMLIINTLTSKPLTCPNSQLSKKKAPLCMTLRTPCNALTPTSPMGSGDSHKQPQAQMHPQGDKETAALEGPPMRARVREGMSHLDSTCHLTHKLGSRFCSSGFAVGVPPTSVVQGISGCPS